MGSGGIASSTYAWLRSDVWLLSNLVCVNAKPLGRPKYRWEYNIKMYLQEMGWEGMDWVDLA